MVRISYRLHRHHQNLSFNTSKGDTSSALRIRPPQWTHYIYALSLGFKSKLLVYYFSLRATGLRSLSQGQFNAQTHSFSPTSMLASFFNCNATTKPHMAINLIFQYQFLGCDWDFCIWIWILHLDFCRHTVAQKHAQNKKCTIVNRWNVSLQLKLVRKEKYFIFHVFTCDKALFKLTSKVVRSEHCEAVVLVVAIIQNYYLPWVAYWILSRTFLHWVGH